MRLLVCLYTPVVFLFCSIYLPVMSNLCWGPRNKTRKLCVRTSWKIALLKE